MVAIPTAEEAKNRVEDIDVLSESDFEKIRNRTEAAIKKGQRKTSIGLNQNDKRYWPMKRYLETLGYTTFGKNNSYGSWLQWSW